MSRSHFEPQSTETFRRSGLVKLNNETIQDVMSDWKCQAAEYRGKIQEESRGMRYDPVTKTYY